MDPDKSAFHSRNKSQKDEFQEGLVFGLDLGTGSIGWSVRDGQNFREAGTLNIDADVADLSERRRIRRQRRTIQSHRQRIEQLHEELESLGLPRPDDPGNLGDRIVELRCRALDGEQIGRTELHACLVHIVQKRGRWDSLPWSRSEREYETDDSDGELADRSDIDAVIESEPNVKHPAHILRKMLTGETFSTDVIEDNHRLNQNSRDKTTKNIVWPRERLVDEFRQIIKKQADYYSVFSEDVQKYSLEQPRSVEDWLLWGEAEPTDHSTAYIVKSRNITWPGSFSSHYPRFDNRVSNLDQYEPYDEEGRPNYTVRKSDPLYREFQLLKELRNLRGYNDQTREANVRPPLGLQKKIREEWDPEQGLDGQRMQEIAEEICPHFTFNTDRDGNPIDLDPPSDSGRAPYSRPTLQKFLNNPELLDEEQKKQPRLVFENESANEAAERMIGNQIHPLVRHRLKMLKQLLDELKSGYGKPDFVSVEVVRTSELMEKYREGSPNDPTLSESRKEFIEAQNRREREREQAREDLREFNVTPSGRNIRRYRLWRETVDISPSDVSEELRPFVSSGEIEGFCPYCLERIRLEEVARGDGVEIDHIVPRSLAMDDSWNNQVVAHTDCNRDKKGDKVPFDAFSGQDRWPKMVALANEAYGFQKSEIFTSNREQALESIDRVRHLSMTSYLAKQARKLIQVKYDWTDQEGRFTEDSPEFVVPGALTGRLRREWGLTTVLYPELPDQEWEDLTPAERETNLERRKHKNRSDLRNHAIDAMIAASTLDWYYLRGYEQPLSGWEKEPGEQQPHAEPIVNINHNVMKTYVNQGFFDIRHHRPSSDNRSHLDQTIYGKRTISSDEADQLGIDSRDIFVVQTDVLGSEGRSGLSEKQLSQIYPWSLQVYVKRALQEFQRNRSLDDFEGAVSEGFWDQLCWQHYQSFRDNHSFDGETEIEQFDFNFPDEVRWPVERIRLFKTGSENRFCTNDETNSYREINEYKRYELYVRPWGDDYRGKLIKIPYWGDRPLSRTFEPPGRVVLVD